MKSIKTFLVLFLLFLFSAQSYSQRNYGGYNFLGITGGVTFFDINTNDLSTKSGTGFMGGLSNRGAFFDDFDLIYGLSFSSSKLSVEGSTSIMGSKKEDIDYTIQGVQLNLLGSYNLVLDHLSLEFGPVLNFNGKMKLDKKQYEDYILTGHTNTTASDIQDISKFDLRLLGGFTAGLRHIRLTLQYQYGLLNTLGKLNDLNLEDKSYTGHSSTIIGAAIIYF